MDDYGCGDIVMYEVLMSFEIITAINYWMDMYVHRWGFPESEGYPTFYHPL